MTRKILLPISKIPKDRMKEKDLTVSLPDTFISSHFLKAKYNINKYNTTQVTPTKDITEKK